MANKKVRDEYMPICDRFFKIREKHRLTQQEFAELLGTTRASVSAIEAGYYTPNFDHIKAIKRKLSVPYEYLLDGTSAIVPATEIVLVQEENKRLKDEIEILRLAISALRK